MKNKTQKKGQNSKMQQKSRADHSVERDRSKRYQQEDESGDQSEMNATNDV